MRCRITSLALLILLALTLAACAPITATPAPGATGLPAATADLSPATAAPTPAATGAVSPLATRGAPATAVLSGVVRHAGIPVANARVELRELGWAVNRTPAVAMTTANERGEFAFENPPLGDYTVIGVFPDGEMDAGGWPPVSIAAGQTITGFIVPIERRLTLLAPIAGAAASETPTLEWKGVEGAANYRVWLLDAGTTEMIVDQTTDATSLAVTQALKPATYQWVVNALNARGEIVASGEDTFVVGGAPAETATPAAGGTPSTAAAGASEAEGLPPTCQPRAGETAVYADRTRGFCFLYPANFEKNAADPGQVNVTGMVVGPPRTEGPDPLAATLLIDVIPAGNLNLLSATEDIVSEFAGQTGIDIERTPIDLGGVPAFLLKGVPGRGGSHDIVVLANGLRFRLLFMPDPEQGFPQVADDFKLLFDTVTQSFTFFMPSGTETEGATQGGAMPRLPDQDRAFNSAREALAKRLGVDPLSIQRLSITEMQWPDSCLGVRTAGQMCAQVITPGWIVILEHDGKQYEAHTDQEGRSVRFANLREGRTPTPRPTNPTM